MRIADCGLRNKSLASRGVPAHGSQTLARIFVAWCAFVCAAEPSLVLAQQVLENEAATSEEADQVRAMVDLGMFQIKDLRPTRNETSKVTFAMVLALAPTIDQQTVEQLEYWQHRLRDQVIIAIRVAETDDFLQPGLNRFRRRVLLRVNRALKAALVSEVLLTEFTFTVN